MASKGSVTCCIGRLKQGDPEAARFLWKRYFHRLVGLAPDADALAARIELRVRQQLADGLVAETARLLATPGGLSRTCRQGLGYKEVLLHLEHGLPLEEAVALDVAHTRRFARRQRAWFRRDPRIRWLDVGDEPLAAMAATRDHWRR